MLSRQHPLILLWPIARSCILLLLPIVVSCLVAQGIFLSIITIVCIPAALFLLWRAYHHWDNTMFLLTEQRLMLAQQHHLFDRQLVECNLYNIQQVQHRVTGFLATLFGFGSISIYTAGMQQPIQLLNIPEVFEVEQQVQSLITSINQS